MSTIDLPNDISTETYVNPDTLQANFAKFATEHTAGTNTDQALASSEIAALNTSMAGANAIGNQSTTVVNADVINANTLNATSGNGTTPLGGTMIYFGTTEPTGWHFPDGAAISRSTYSDLFAVIGTMYGSGDGSTTFNLPDARGYNLRVVDDGAGVDTGAATRTDRGDGTTGDNVGTKQPSATKDHFHEHRHLIQPYAEDTNDGGTTSSQYSVESYTTGTTTSSYDVDAAGDTQVGVNDSDGDVITDANPADENRVVNININLIIRIL